jgi:hypothetical protein
MIGVTYTGNLSLRFREDVAFVQTLLCLRKSSSSSLNLEEHLPKLGKRTKTNQELECTVLSKSGSSFYRERQCSKEFSNT